MTSDLNLEQSLVPYTAHTLPALRRILILAPHPDDEVFGCGGAAALHSHLGADVVTVVLSSGEQGGSAAIREGESREAARLLGVPEPHFWRMPDRSLTYEEKFVQRLVELMLSIRPCRVYAPSVWEVHPDHRALALAAVEAVRRTQPDVPELAFYEVGAALRPNALVDITSVLEKKAAAMAAFASQLTKQRYDVQITGLNRFRAYTLGLETTAAEAFEIYAAHDLQAQLLPFYRALRGASNMPRGSGADPLELPLVSIIVRSMDRPELHDALLSLAGQTWVNLEVVVVNASGHAHSPIPPIMGNAQIRLIGDGGTPLSRSAAANAGLIAARGEYIGFLDDDDWLLPAHVAGLVSCLEDRAGLVAAYSSTSVELLGKTVDIYAQPFNSALLAARNYLPIHSVLMRSAFARECKFDESLEVYEDWDYWLQLTQLGPFQHVEQKTAIYRADLGDSQISAHLNRDVVDAGLKKLFSKWGGRWTAATWVQLHHQLVGLKGLELKSASLQAEVNALSESLLHSREEIRFRAAEELMRNEYIRKCEARIGELERGVRLLERNAAQRDDFIEDQRQHIQGLESLVKRLRSAFEQRDAEACNTLADEKSAFAQFQLQAEQQTSALERERDEAHRTLEAIQRTLSWRITTPLRRLRSAIASPTPHDDRVQALDVPPKHDIPKASEGGAKLVAIPWQPPEPLSSWKQAVPASVPPKTRALDIPAVLVLPVFNGLQYLPTLFESLQTSLAALTTVKLVVVEDASSDAAVLPWLQSRMSQLPFMELICNEENAGFVHSVNRGMARALELLPAQTVGAVVILNSDIELPARWLERLCAPLAEQPASVASVTPLTNAGTICSFPEFLVDNQLPPGMSVQDLDAAFQPLAGRLVEAPTGVGFCMALNSQLLQAIGLFDAQRYGKGYGEENDWCQRAKELGYSNVLQPGLFVWHKHGGSFPSAEKEALVARNLALLAERYPSYSQQVQDHIAANPLALHRACAALNYVLATMRCVLFVDHGMGGGANDYREQQVRSTIEAGNFALCYSEDFAGTAPHLKVYFPGQVFAIPFERKDLVTLGEPGSIARIFYNNAVTFQSPESLPGQLLDLKARHGATLVTTLHDFYPVCPSYTLLNHEHVYCGVPSDLEICRKCLPRNAFMLSSTRPCTDIDLWRGEWGKLLEASDEVLCFSDSSLNILLKAYPFLAGAPGVRVQPHTVYSLPKRTPRVDHYGPAVLGVVGAIGLQKGSRIIRRMARLIEQRALPVRIVIIGEADIRDFPSCVTITGRYQPGQLPDLIEQHGVNFAALTSVWPETFSYVTSELMAMNLRILAFDLGAPAERLAAYPLARLVSEVTSEAMLDALLDWQAESQEAGPSPAAERTAYGIGRASILPSLMDAGVVSGCNSWRCRTGQTITTAI